MQKRKRGEKMKCPNCDAKMEKGEIELEESEITVEGLICPKCYELKFEEETVEESMGEYREYLKTEKPVLKLKRKISQMSGKRMGIYFPQDLIDSLKIKSGESVELYPINKNTIIIRRAETKRQEYL
jgi:hypothetical protein